MQPAVAPMGMPQVSMDTLEQPRTVHGELHGYHWVHGMKMDGSNENEKTGWRDQEHVH